MAKFWGTLKKYKGTDLCGVGGLSVLGAQC